MVIIPRPPQPPPSSSSLPPPLQPPSPMPAPKSYSGATSTGHDHNQQQHHHHSKQHTDDLYTDHENEEQQEHVNGNGNKDDDEVVEQEETNGDDEDDGGEPSSSGDGESGEISDIDEDNSNNGGVDRKGEFIVVRLSDIRKEVQCPICLGIIKKTRTVMECLHRFCRECIDKSMRMGNNECPACRTHCASRRSLRDDPNFDALIAALYPDIDQYEEEELAFQEDEKLRNKQIQDAIAQTFQRQTEALSRKRKRPQGNYRKRRNYQTEDDEYGGKDTSSADEVKPRRSKRCKGQSSDVPSGDGGVDQTDKEVHRDSGGGALSSLVVGSSEMLVWGKGGMRSNTRYGGGGGGNGKHGRSRLSKLVDHLRNSKQNDNEMDIQVVLVSLDEQKEYTIEHSYLCGKPALSVGQLCQFIALKTSLSPQEVEILAAKGVCPKLGTLISTRDQNSVSTVLDACEDELQVLNSEETLAALKTAYNFTAGHLMLAYRQKLST